MARRVRESGPSPGVTREYFPDLGGLVGNIADDLGYALVVEPDWDAARLQIDRHAIADDHCQRMIDLKLAAANEFHGERLACRPPARGLQ